MTTIGRVRKVIRFSELTDQTGMTDCRPLLHCLVCGNDCSANRGDYFHLSPTYGFRCCGHPMILAVKRTIYRHVEIEGRPQ